MRAGYIMGPYAQMLQIYLYLNHNAAISVSYAEALARETSLVSWRAKYLFA